MNPKASLRYPAILGLTLGLGLSLSLGAAWSVGQWEAARRQTQFQQQIENLATALQRSLNRYTDVLTFLHDYYRVAQQPVSRQEFSGLVARSLATYPGIQALEWAPLVRGGDRAAFEAGVQAEGYPAFAITELSPTGQLRRAGARAEYVPVTYVAPFLTNEAALGYDLASDPTRAAAIAPARATGRIMATERIRLVQEQRDQFGFLVVLPLYPNGDIPPDQPTREAEFEGILLGVFRVADVVEEALQDLSADINFALYDQDAEAERQFLGQYEAASQTVVATEDSIPPPEAVCLRPQDCTRLLTLGQRQWRVAFAPAATYGLGRSYGAPLTLLTGLLLTGTLALLLHSLQAELARTRALGNMKLKFFSMASHELRTPLSTILLSAESLRGDVTSLEVAQPKVDRILTTAQHMGQQIADLLTLTRAEAGKLEFHPTLVDAVTFCQEVIEEVQPQVSQPIALGAPGSPVTAFWDRRLVRSLLTNLLLNAANYSPGDRPIHLRLSSDGSQATLTVQDGGRGIPAADLVHIREAFQRGSNVGDRPGSGLGLAIVHTVVTLHRGHWHIDSTEGQGTTVTVALPLE
ncbi:CHASE domain-containing protein [Nodosilinea sp. PGN35]|uniref:CHASE domain-containing sensor histidine kinase n=1 Tax=Nodosilinea sp. PGN35 TaxID=3020489 RepID=UPI0023B2696C|nr:CHASE domain-containing protein [Nodosilinea sp. TSF1-S3]MDF0367407.1 CHASE domain-containing protein [Nodosilinea sp. TSF1-S3]